MSETVLNFLTSDLLHEYAGDRSFKLGQQYFKSGSVHDLKASGGKVSAKVSGTDNYKVKLWEEEDDDEELGYDCSCPYAEEGNFCKHCVAVGLAWIAGDKPQKRQKSVDKIAAPTLEDIENYLERQDKSALVEMLMREVRDNETLRGQLTLTVARRNPGGLNLETYRDELNRVFEIDDIEDYDEYGDYLSSLENSEDIDPTVESIRDLLKDGHFDAVIELCEHGLRLISEIRDSIDEVDEVDDASEKFQEMHLAACEKANLETEELVKDLFRLELDHLLYDTPHHYGGILGEKGINLYRQLVEKEWFKIPALKPGDAAPYGGRRSRLKDLMDVLHWEDFDQLIEIESRDLSSQLRYLKIAEMYRDAEKYDQALDWAERAISDFPPDKLDWRLGEFLAGEYHRHGRHDEAMKIIWNQFEERSDFSNYENLKKHADQTESESAWKIWREKALDLIRQKIAASKNKPAGSWYHRPEDNSLLVRIFLHENLMEEAWQEAVAGGCSEALWLELAKKREHSHPADSLKIYRDRIELKIKETNNQAYEQAVAWLKAAKNIMARLDQENEFYKYMSGLRATYKAKRNFVKLLDSTRW